jgi:hypothetical protein
MAAKIGILGESTSTAVATVTLYTVPADKAARVRILYAQEGSTSTNNRFSLLIGSPGSEIQIKSDITVSGTDVWSGPLQEATPNPALSILAAVQGSQNKVGAFDLDGESFAASWFISPMPVDYYLSTGDTVKFINQDSTVTDCLVQVQGVEDDA